MRIAGDQGTDRRFYLESERTMKNLKKPTPEQLARFAEFSCKLMSMTDEDLEIEGRVVMAMAKASEMGISAQEDSVADYELDREVLAAIDEMRKNPENDQEILEEMERNYRSSMVPVTIPFPRSIHYAVACDTYQAPVSVGDVDLSGNDKLIIEATRDETDRLIIQFSSTLPLGTRIVVPDHPEWIIELKDIDPVSEQTIFKLVLSPEETRDLKNMPSEVEIHLPDDSKPYKKVMNPRPSEQS
jgi:hypothetical protein